ncbi:hypothetical protein K8T06_01640, partial [bacterium]|nr:hypothetical protein [bacterium]
MKRVAALGKNHVVPLGLPDIERAYPELLDLKHHRSKLEYYYTCGPCYIKYLTENFTEIDIITYLDADLYFYGDPKQLFNDFKSHSIGVMAHHIPELRVNQWQGIYNVGWISFRMDRDGETCLETWRKQCVDWCFEKYEGGKYADQLYLDEWPDKYVGFHEFVHRGANLAAWNVGDFKYFYKDGKVYVDQDLLIFYHFHGFKKIAPCIYDTNLFLSLKSPDIVLKRYVFAEYIEKLNHFSENKNVTNSIRRYRPRF